MTGLGRAKMARVEAVLAGWGSVDSRHSNILTTFHERALIIARQFLTIL